MFIIYLNVMQNVFETQVNTNTHHLHIHVLLFVPRIWKASDLGHNLAAKGKDSNRIDGTTSLHLNRVASVWIFVTGRVAHFKL